MSFWNQCNFPDPSTEMASRLFLYHDLVLVVVVMVLVLVGWFLMVFLLGSLFFGGKMARFVYKNELLEFTWTVVPSLFLFVLGFVSLKNLYDMEVGDNVDFVVKVTGHQWYWEYRYEVNFSNVMKNNHDEYLLSWLGIMCKSGVDYMNSFINNGYDSLLVSDDSQLDELGLVSDDSQLDEVGLVSDDSQLDEVGLVNNVENSFEFDLHKRLLEGFVSSEFSVLKGCMELFMKGDWFLKYDSYLVPESELLNKSLNLKTGFRNQDVSDPCFLAHSKKNEILVSTADVMHSWGVSELGVKADAVPGRMNSLAVEPLCSGVAFGNCYELCGEGHSQMPVVVFISSYNNIIWVLKKEILLTDYVEEFLGNF